MFYLLLRLLYEDWQSNALTKKQYLTGIERLAYLHNTYYDAWQLTYMKYCKLNSKELNKDL
jgi:hypothetical protein